MRKFIKLLGKLIYTAMIIGVIFVMIKIYNIYKENNFNDFIKTEYKENISTFTRDKQNMYEDMYSYKIESSDYNDALFYKNIEVKKNTPYKVSCKIKTKDVKSEVDNSLSGAQICILNTTEASKSIVGTVDKWQEVEFLFNSKNRQNIDIGFRLGGYGENTMGTAWFTDFKIEEGNSQNSTSWNTACFIIKNLDVNIENNNVKLNMTNSDIDDISNGMRRFKNSCENLSGGLMNVNYKIIEIDEELTNLSYDETNGYYVAPKNVENLISKYVNNEIYDHIFVAIRLGDMMHQDDIKVNDWIGLGSMDYYGIGFSNIRLPNNSNSYMYKYDININRFPEEVFIHEFLHSLERTLVEYEYEIPALHDYEKYNYQTKELTGLKDWYQDYMRCNILDTKNNKYIGLDPIVYSLKPTNENCFLNPIELDFIYEPSNIFEEMKQIFTNFLGILKTVKLENEVQIESSGV